MKMAELFPLRVYPFTLKSSLHQNLRQSLPYCTEKGQNPGVLAILSAIGLKRLSSQIFNLKIYFILLNNVNHCNMQILTLSTYQFL